MKTRETKSVASTKIHIEECYYIKHDTFRHFTPRKHRKYGLTLYSNL